MTSQAKIDANRRNAVNSTGPKTAAGKAASSKNSLRHALLARIGSLPETDQAEYRAILEGLEDDRSPRGTMEHELVAQIAECVWRNRRLLQVECEIFAYHDRDRLVGCLRNEHDRRRDEMISGKDYLANPPALEPLRREANEAAQKRDEAAPLALIFLHASPTLDKTSRYATSNERKMFKLLDRLERCQAARAASTAADSGLESDAQDQVHEPQFSPQPPSETPEPHEPTPNALSATPDERVSCQTKPEVETHRTESGNHQVHDDKPLSTATDEAAPAAGAVECETNPPAKTI